MVDLYSPLKIKNTELKNRLVYPAAVMPSLNTGENRSTVASVRHYEDIAEGGAGMVVVEASCINLTGLLNKRQLGIWNDSFIKGIKRISEAIKKHDGVAILQIHHAGLNAAVDAVEYEDIFGPSPHRNREGEAIRELTDIELQASVIEFGLAARRAEKAGFDGVEIHGAHGYLLSQFLSPKVNIREDKYGEDRTLFIREIIEEVKNFVPEDFIIGLRMGANYPDIKTATEYAKVFEEVGIDYLSVSHGFTTEEPEDLEIIDEDYSWIANAGFNISKEIDIPVISVYDIDTPQKADNVIKNGYSDLVAACRGLLCDSKWLEKYKDGEEIVECIKCKRCFFNTDEGECPVVGKRGQKK